MTAFRLKPDEPASEGIRRVAHERTENAVEMLRDEDADPVEAVHEARKDMKKLRAVLKLVRPAIGDTVYRRENDRFRSAGQALSDTRDAQVRSETLDTLAERFDDDPPPGGWWALRAVIGGGEQPAVEELESVRERAAAEIEAGDAAIDAWPLGAEGFGLVRPGVKRAYSRARKGYSRACAAPTDEALHEWRKRSKDLWYQLRLVRDAWPGVLGATADEAHELSDLLGDDHDLVVLQGHLDEVGKALTAEQLSHLGRLIGARRAALQEKSFAYGARLLAEKPKRFAARLESYWEAGEI